MLRRPAAPQVSAGGLVSALMGVSNFKTCWVGWPGALARSLPAALVLCKPAPALGTQPVHGQPFESRSAVLLAMQVRMQMLQCMWVRLHSMMSAPAHALHLSLQGCMWRRALSGTR